MQKTPNRHLTSAVLLGLLFPVTATLYDIWSNPTPLTFSSLLSRHLDTPLLLILDMVPVVMGLWGFVMGKARMKTDLANLESQRELENLFLKSPDMLCIADARGNFLKVNPAFVRRLGYPEQELLSRPFYDFVHPDDREATQQAAGRLSSGKQMFSFENRYRTQSGEWRWFSWETILVENGSRLYGIARDITEAKLKQSKTEAERMQLQAILDSADFTVISTDTDGIIRTLNRKALELLKYTEEELVGKLTPEIIHKPEEVIRRAQELSAELGITVSPGFETFVAKAARTGLPDENEWTYIRKDGSTFPVSLSVTALTDSKGEITGYLGIGKDLTRLREYERMLEENERRTAQFLESLPLGIFILDANGKPFYANTQSTELLGEGIRPDADATTLPEVYSSYILGTDQTYPPEKQPIAIALSGKKSYVDDMVIRRPDRNIPIEVWGTPLLDREGKVAFAIAAFNDITQRKADEAEIRKLSLVASKTSNAVVITNPEGKLEWANHAFETITGYTMQEIQGKKPGYVLRGPRTSRETEKLIREKLDAREHFLTEIINYRNDGTPYWLELNISPMVEEHGNELIGFIAIESDVTERKKDQLRILLLHAISQAIFQAADLRNAMEISLRQMQRVLEWDGLEFYAVTADGKNLEAIAATYDIPFGEKALDSVRSRLLFRKGDGLPGIVWETGKAVWTNDIENIAAINPERRKAAVEAGLHTVAGFPIFIQDTFAGMLLAGSRIEFPQDKDLSEIMQSCCFQLSLLIRHFQDAAKLKNYAQDLEKANFELDQFAYIVSHDLKAPLRGMYLLSEWVEEDFAHGKTESLIPNLQLIRNRATRLEGLIEGILKYSRIGKQNIPLQDFDGDELLDSVVDSVSAPQNFHIRVQKGMGTIRAKKTLLFQVLSNLLTNAVKYNDKAAGEVSVSFSKVKGGMEFRIADNGPGIDPAYHDRIFQVFQRLNGRDEVEGTGIGLSLVKKIIDEEGGSIRVESEPGKGAAFIFTWPSPVI